MKFIQITDTHFVGPGEQLYGLDPAQRLAEIVTLINAEHADSDFVLITGDLADLGQVKAYQRLAEILTPLIPPVHLMLGNHDSRAPFAKVFGADAMSDGFAQFRISGRGADILCLDTLVDVPGEHAGHLCASRLGWLSREIARQDGPWLLALHHPPFDVGLPHMDDIRLDAASSSALAEVIAEKPPLMILCGHVHRPIHGVWRGVPWHIQRAVNHQVAYRPVRGPKFMFSDEAAEFSVISVGGDEVTIHTRTMTEFEEFDARGPHRDG